MIFDISIDPVVVYRMLSWVMIWFTFFMIIDNNNPDINGPFVSIGIILMVLSWWWYEYVITFFMLSWLFTAIGKSNAFRKR